MSDVLEHAVDSIRVGHITFYITPHPDFDKDVFNIYSSARGEDVRFLDVAWSFEEANQMVAEEIRKLESYLEAKRDKAPTTKQIMFLFREKIPIPVNLTWGEAHDLIDERLAQIAYERQTRNEEKAKQFKGLWVGKRITCKFFHPERIISGEVVKLTSYQGKPRYAYIKFDGDKNTSQFFIDSLPKMIEEEVEP